MAKNGFDFKIDRRRGSSADSSTPTVVEGQLEDNKELGMTHII